MPLFRSSYFCSSYYDRLSSVILYTRNVQMMKAWKVGEPVIDRTSNLGNATTKSRLIAAVRRRDLARRREDSGLSS